MESAYRLRQNQLTNRYTAAKKALENAERKANAARRELHKVARILMYNNATRTNNVTQNNINTVNNLVKKYRSNKYGNLSLRKVSGLPKSVINKILEIARRN